MQPAEVEPLLVRDEDEVRLQTLDELGRHLPERMHDQGRLAAMAPTRAHDGLGECPPMRAQAHILWAASPQAIGQSAKPARVLERQIEPGQEHGHSGPPERHDGRERRQPVRLRDVGGSLREVGLIAPLTPALTRPKYRPLAKGPVGILEREMAQPKARSRGAARPIGIIERALIDVPPGPARHDHRCDTRRHVL